MNTTQEHTLPAEVRSFRREQLLHVRTSRGDGGTSEYTSAELETMAQYAGIDHLNTRDLRRYVLLYCDKQRYALTMRGYVPMPEISGSQMHQLAHALAAWPMNVVDFFSYKEVENKKTGETELKCKPLTQDLFLQQYSSPIKSVRLQYDVLYGHLEKDELVLAAGRRVKIPPVHDAAVDQWLRAFASGRYPMLEIWLILATSENLNEALAALLMIGASRAGKDSLVKAVAKFWADCPIGTSFDVAVDPSNTGDINKSPLILICEELGVNGFNKADPFAALKKAVTDPQHRTNAKYTRMGMVHGYWRVMATLNDADSLLRGVSKSSDNLKAAAQRFLYIPIEDTPELLAGRTALGLVDTKLPEDALANHFDRIYSRIAGHISWLATQRPGQLKTMRNELMSFMSKDELIRLKLVGDSATTEAVFKVLFDRMTSETVPDGVVRYMSDGEHRLLVKSKPFIDAYLAANPRSSPASARKALQGVCVNQQGSAAHRINGEVVKGCRIDLLLFREYCISACDYTEYQFSALVEGSV